MSTHDDKVKRLLDGEIDEAEIAADPVLSSLAERIFGLNIEPIAPTKPSQQPVGPEVEVIAAKTSHEPMIEIIQVLHLRLQWRYQIYQPYQRMVPKIKMAVCFLKVFGLTSLIVRSKHIRIVRIPKLAMYCCKVY